MYIPRKDELIEIAIDVTSIVSKRLVRRKEIAPGATSSAIVKMIPIDFNAATIVIDKSIKRP